MSQEFNMYETQIKNNYMYDIPTTEMNQLVVFNTDILRSSGTSRTDIVRNIKYCHVVGVTLDRVLDWILDLLTTLAYNL
jgi:hypothetical protein